MPYTLIHSEVQFVPCTLVTQIALYTLGGAIYALHHWWHNLHQIHSVAQFAPCTLVKQIALYTLGGANCTTHTSWHTLCLTTSVA